MTETSKGIEQAVEPHDRCCACAKCPTIVNEATLCQRHAGEVAAERWNPEWNWTWPRRTKP